MPEGLAYCPAPFSFQRQGEGWRLQLWGFGAGQTYRMVASGKTVAVHPTSALGRKRPQCIVFAQLIRTTRDYARDVTTIDPAWLPELAPAFMARHRLPAPAPNLVRMTSHF